MDDRPDRRHHDLPATGELPCLPPSIPDDAPQVYREFWRLWNEEKFYRCHDVLEELWRETEGPQRLFYNGLIHCAVAVYQHRRGNAIGAARQLLRAQVKLRRFRSRHYQVDVDEVLAGVARTVAGSVEQISAGQRAQLPALEKSLEERIAREYPEWGCPEREYSEEFGHGR
jgi:predicted metal-dependent hydrolase